MKVICLMVRSQGLVILKTPLRSTISNFSPLPYPRFDAIVKSCSTKMNSDKLELLESLQKL
jgi:hypothetical protein